MRVLYVTPFWTSLTDILSSDNESTGMPAFVLPLKRLLELGHTVDIVFITDLEVQELLSSSKSRLINNSNTVGVIYFNKEKKLKKIKEYFKLSAKIQKKVLKLLRDEKYDFVYGHSEYSLAAIKAANKVGIPCGIRMYGTFVYRDYEKHGFLKVLLSRPLEIMTYNVKCNFLLMTNDGTDGDKAYKKFAITKNRFLFWMNGIDHSCMPTQIQLKTVADKYCIKAESVLYLARVTKWKRQEKAVDVITELHKRGIEKHIYFAGQISSTDEMYYAYLLKKAKDQGVEDYVHFIGTVDRSEINALALLCKYSLIMYEGSCLGNVFHELFAAKAVLICLDDNGSLEGIIDNGINGYAVHSIDEVVRIISKLDRNDQLSMKIRSAAAETSKQIMKTWNARIADEIKLIIDSIQDSKVI